MSCEAIAKAKQDSESQRNLDDFIKWKKEAADPPTEYSKEVLRFSHECPSQGQGKSRDKYHVALDSKPLGMVFCPQLRVINLGRALPIPSFPF